MLIIVITGLYKANRWVNSLYQNDSGGITMTTSPTKKWWKIGAAAFLATGILAACGDNDSDDDMNDPMEEHEDHNTDEIEETDDDAE